MKRLVHGAMKEEIPDDPEAVGDKNDAAQLGAALGASPEASLRPTTHKRMVKLSEDGPQFYKKWSEKTLPAITTLMKTLMAEVCGGGTHQRKGTRFE